MSSLMAAERVLSLVASRERSALILAGMREARPGACQFWRDVGRVVFFRVWEDASEHPLSTFRLALWGALLNWVLAASVAIILATLLRTPTHWGTSPSRSSVWIALAVGSTLVPMLAGWEVGRRSGGREVVVALAALGLNTAACGILAGLSALQIGRVGPPVPDQQPDVIPFLAGGFFLVVGAILFRVRAVKRWPPTNPGTT